MRSAIEVGDLVWSGYSGHLRFGTVTDRRIDQSGWAYYTVNWHKNEDYEKVQNFYSSLNSNKDYGLKEFKAGQVHPITSERIEGILDAYYEFVEDDET